MFDIKPIAAVPDVTGYILENAESILKEAGIKEISVIVTSAPIHSQKFSINPELPCRVLRQKLLDSNTVELVACRL